MLGLSRTVVTGLIGAGFVSPTRGARNEHRFSFQDLMLLRTAYALQQAKVAPRKILRALTKLQANLPDELPLTGLRITAVGANVVVRDRLGPWDADSGQLLMDFEVAPVAGSVAFLQPRSGEPPREHEAWFERGEQAEETDPKAAEAAYRQAVALSPAYVHAYLNLGALLCEARRCDEAVELYEAALQHGAEDPLLHFNHAIALEDQGKPKEALASYERALVLNPDLADAHYNAGRLQQSLGDERGALRHFSAYRRLERSEHL
ncbi:tetratricopeptide repeat protein [Methylibium sp.]|uniref:tetratricopeptide repeat protein n=1 Tax=Methylibium sp. TaxID=2067992 RepID=UPI00183F2103|nr:tetratricopeptide repeat protein [Methylibium sp.]MBA3590864.1 tetratricopeptide repeat protein [Methylibium sp.]